MPDTTRAFDFSPLPQVLCINTSNVKDFKPLAFRREDPGLQKLPSNSQPCPVASLLPGALSSTRASPSIPPIPLPGGSPRSPRMDVGDLQTSPLLASPEEGRQVPFTK